MRQIRIKLLTPDARAPEYKTDGAAGLDLYASEERIINPWCIAKIRTGVAFELPDGVFGRISPRSGMSSRGLIAIEGTLDSDYRGEVWVQILNASHNVQRVPLHARVAQMILLPFVRVDELLVVGDDAELSPTARGTGGFGSTGA